VNYNTRIDIALFRKSSEINVSDAYFVTHRITGKNTFSPTISPGFSGKNRGATPSVAAPGVTHPSDATAFSLTITQSLSNSQISFEFLQTASHSVI